MTDERTLFPALTFLTGKAVLEVCYKCVHVLTSANRGLGISVLHFFSLKYLTTPARRLELTLLSVTEAGCFVLRLDRTATDGIVC